MSLLVFLGTTFAAGKSIYSSCSGQLIHVSDQELVQINVYSHLAMLLSGGGGGAMNNEGFLRIFMSNELAFLT